VFKSYNITAEEQALAVWESDRTLFDAVTKATRGKAKQDNIGRSGGYEGIINE
jgi:hypothetical protein